MKPLHDWRCGRCDNTFEERGATEDPPICPLCGNENTRVVFIGAPAVKAAGDYNPYEALDRVIPDSKPIKSFANDRRKGGKDR